MSRLTLQNVSASTKKFTTYLLPPHDTLLKSKLRSRPRYRIGLIGRTHERQGTEDNFFCLPCAVCRKRGGSESVLGLVKQKCLYCPTVIEEGVSDCVQVGAHSHPPTFQLLVPVIAVTSLYRFKQFVVFSLFVVSSFSNLG